MISFQVIIEKFGKQGEKTGWTYFVVPLDIAEKIHPGNRKSFRVKGTLDKVKINGVALIPMGEGNFIMPLKTDLRKQIKKGKGDTLEVRIELDKEVYQLNQDRLADPDRLRVGSILKLPADASRVGVVSESTRIR
jgi:hypothetical protein